jgi:hypothetical protein
MIIVDNKLQIAKIRLAYIFTIMASSSLLVYSFFSKTYTDGKLISFIIGIIMFIIFLFLLLIKPEYIYFSIENNNKIIIKNYTAFPLFRKYKAFEIPISSIYDYEIKKVFLDQLIFMRISVKSKNKIGKYPWLSLSSLSKKELKRLIETLDKILPAEKRKKII